MTGAAEKINHFSGAAKTNWLRTLSRIHTLTNPTNTRAQLVMYPLIVATFILLPQLPKIVFMACDCGGNSHKKNKPISLLHAGQTTETIAFTEREYRAERMTREEKLKLDNESIRNNSLAHLNGVETKADEIPNEWDQYS